jgi:hypothetical protein
MGCKHWKNDWVARLYDELEPDEERRLVAHLEDCAECRATLEGLNSSRELLEEGAPRVPATPRVVVLQSRWSWPSLGAFAAGAACAALVFGLGWFRGPAQNETLELLKNDLFAMTERVRQLEGNRDVTPAAMRKELDNLERRLTRERVRDLEQVVLSFTAAERRTGNWMDQTDNRLVLLALRQDPSLRER